MKEYSIAVIIKDAFDQKSLEKMLQTYSVTFFTSIESFKEQIAQYSLIIVDGKFGEDAFEFSKEMKISNEMHTIPILFIFDKLGSDLLTKMFQSGGNDYVTRPFTPLELAARIYVHIQFVKQKKELENLALYDSMTSIFNRRTFFINAEKAFLFAVERRLKLHLALVNLYTLHNVNDDYGNFTGDRAIVTLGESIKKHFGAESILGRLNGNVFAAAIINKSEEYVQDALGRIKEDGEAFDIGGAKPVKVTTGYASLYSKDESVDSLLLEACETMSHCNGIRITRKY